MAMKKKNLPEVVPELFEHEQFGQFRFIKRDEEIWFVAVDLCHALDIQNVRQNLADFPDDEKMTVVLTDSHSKNGVTNTVSNTYGSSDAKKGWIENRVTVISEPGLYRLIFMSRKPEAEKFKRWVFHEVLPSIRKYGYYIKGVCEMKTPSGKPPEEEKIYVEITGDENFKLFKKKYPEIDFEKALRRLGFTKIYDEHGYYHEEDVFLLRFSPDDYEKISRAPLSVCFLEQIIPNKKSTNRRIGQTISQSRKKLTHKGLSSTLSK